MLCKVFFFTVRILKCSSCHHRRKKLQCHLVGCLKVVSFLSSSPYPSLFLVVPTSQDSSVSNWHELSLAWVIWFQFTVCVVRIVTILVSFCFSWVRGNMRTKGGFQKTMPISVYTADISVVWINQRLHILIYKAHGLWLCYTRSVKIDSLLLREVIGGCFCQRVSTA